MPMAEDNQWTTTGLVATRLLPRGEAVVLSSTTQIRSAPVSSLSSKLAPSSSSE